MKRFTFCVLCVIVFFTAFKKKDENPSPANNPGSCTLTSLNSTIVSPTTNQTYTGQGELTYDASGRIIKLKGSGDTPNTYDISYLTYDSQNRVVESNDTYFDGSSESWFSTEKYKYDDLNRVLLLVQFDIDGNYDSTVYQYKSSTEATSVSYHVYSGGGNQKDTVTNIYETDANGNIIKIFSNESTKSFAKDSFLIVDEIEYYNYPVPSYYQLLFSDYEAFPPKLLEKNHKSYGYNLYGTTITDTIINTSSYTYKFDSNGKLIQQTYDGTQADNGNIETLDFIYTCK